MPCGGTQAAGPAGHPRNERVRKAPKQPAPQGTQDTSGPGGHPSNKEAQRPRRYLETASLEAPKEQVVVGASSLRPRKASKTRNGAEAKKKFSNPQKVFFLLGPQQSAPLTANPLHWPSQQSEPWQAVSPLETNRRLRQSPS